MDSSVPHVLLQSHPISHVDVVVPQPLNHQDNVQASLNSTINSLNLGNGPNPNTPSNSPISSPGYQNPVEVIQNQSPRVANQHHNPNTNHPARDTFTLCPSWFPSKSSALKWSWIGGEGPFLTTGTLKDNQGWESETDSDSSTATLFNLDSLNRERPEVLLANQWNRGQIPESPDSFMDSLVRRMNRERLHFERGESSKGP